MGISKVLYGDSVLIDLTSDTVTASSLALGVTAHDKAGNLITGVLGSTFAFIRVDIPSGNTAVCKLQGSINTVTPFIVDGRYVFPIPSAGTYIVDSMSGSIISKTETVVVTSSDQGNSIYVNLKTFAIITEGDVTPGYELTRQIRTGSNNLIRTNKNNNFLNIAAPNGYYTNGVATAAKVPCGSYNKLVAEVNWVSHNASNNYVELAIWTDASGVGTEKLVNEARKAHVKITGGGTFELWCSSYGDSYVGTYHYNGTTPTRVEIINMYLI